MSKPPGYYAAYPDEAEAEIARLRAALEEILSLQPLKTQHEHHVAMLKTLDIIRKALAR